MISLQKLGKDIFSKQPDNFYIFGGSEYGIKLKYIEQLSAQFGEIIETPSVLELVTTLSTKRLVPINSGVFVVRYDTDFVAQVDSNIAKNIFNLNIPGVIVCIYEDDKIINKLDKYFPNNVCEFGKVSPAFIHKYLEQDFPSINSDTLSSIADIASNYQQAQVMCQSILYRLDKLAGLTKQDLIKLFGIQSQIPESYIKQEFASRNSTRLMMALDKYEGNLEDIFYVLFSTLLELEKIINSRYSDSNLKSSIKEWDHRGIYNMFMQVYESLMVVRYKGSDPYKELISLLSLLAFKSIPEVGDIR